MQPWPAGRGTCSEVMFRDTSVRRHALEAHLLEAADAVQALCKLHEWYGFRAAVEIEGLKIVVLRLVRGVEVVYRAEAEVRVRFEGGV